ncbi:putative molecular chaperone GrpE [Candidatus Zinderia insecticola CARI]|uniref:Protein GrpE n=1 Tax=Zinderia insecticola (strain CARI) TaxID=871271 RepID=E0TIY9_ZINIC|nr:putative molecular chaperone GrpE [Candidatus Zinderia insecticola CARI]
MTNPDISKQNLEEKEKNEILKNKVKDLKKKILEIKEYFLRKQAENQNIYKRSKKNLKKMIKFSIENFAKSLLEIKDSLEKSLLINSVNDSLKIGIKITLKKFNIIFKNNKIIEINPNIGEIFNPMIHQVISVSYNNLYEENTIISVLEKGYKINNRLLRPSLVIVNKK